MLSIPSLVLRHSQIFDDNLSNTFISRWFGNRRSSHTVCLNCSTLFCLSKATLLLESSFMSYHHSLNLFFLSKTYVHDMMLSPYSCWSILSTCDEVFPNRAKKYQVHSFPRAPCWVTWKISVNKWKKKRNLMVTESQDLSYTLLKYARW